jgi:trimethylamine--corrinoid protein Co-methyltransferase
MLPSCHLFGGHSVEPIDRPPNTRHLDSVFDWITLSDKALRVYGIGTTRVDDGLEMIKLGYGIDEAQLCATPHTMSILNVNSPLLVDEPLLLGSIALAKRGQATVVSPVAMSGAMSPITASGSLIQHNAESVGVSAYLQMEVPGCHLFYGSLVAAVDMRSGAPAMGDVRVDDVDHGCAHGWSALCPSWPWLDAGRSHHWLREDDARRRPHRDVRRNQAPNRLE